jgi:hypothetical protein
VTVIAAVRRGAAVLAVLPPLLLAPAASALALTRDAGDDPGPSLSVFQTLGYFVGIPVLIFALLAVLVYAPSMSQGPRYRPGWAWWHDAVWFSGPKGEDMAFADPGEGRDPADATTTGGGASARW